jgi:hypothetical protein
MIRDSWRRWVPVAVGVGCASVTSIPLRADSARSDRPPAERAAIAARTLRGGGSWQNGPESRRAAQRWDIDVTHADDDSLSGRVTVQGSPLIRNGTLQGRIAGWRIEGSVTDDAGNHVATFVGTISRDRAMQGTYEDRTGEIGQWSWEGQLPP